MKRKAISMVISGALAMSMLFSGCSTQSKEKEVKVEYPTKQVELTVPSSPGSGTDILTRAVADYLSKDWGKPVVVVNKPGGSGVTGALEVYKSKPDGYSVCAVTSANTTMQQAASANPQIKLEDQTFVARIFTDPIAFIVKADAPWKDVKEFGDWALKNPDKVVYTSPGAVQTAAFAFAEWYTSIGGDVKKVNMLTTTGGSDSATKIAGGNATINFGDFLSPSSLVSAGKLKYLALSAPKRNPYLPDVPTVEESGVKGLTMSIWMGITAPKGTPDYVTKKWNDSIEKMMKDPTFQEKIKGLKASPGYLNSADFTKFAQDETTRLTDLANKLGIRK
ncbi:MAG: hypothetical protein K0R31_776 [Clostridiales bacterium]|jgi:tripartite-type tricarboxylate transporter receptor subunit TctC|nr:hypothetical protein [Clostridiales bacterium]